MKDIIKTIRALLTDTDLRVISFKGGDGIKIATSRYFICSIERSVLYPDKYVYEDSCVIYGSLELGETIKYVTEFLKHVRYIKTRIDSDTFNEIFKL